MGFLAFSSESDAYDRSRTNASCQYNSLMFEGDVRPIGSNSVILKEDEIICFEIKDKLKLSHYLRKNFFFSKSGNVRIGSRNTPFGKQSENIQGRSTREF